MESIGALQQRALVEAYLSELANQGASESTVKTYDDRLRYWLDWLRAVEIPLEAVTRDTVQQYLSDMRVKGCAPKYVLARLSAVKGFFSWLVDVRELLPKNPCRAIKIKIPRRLPRFLEEKQALELMNAAAPGRERVICELLYGSGIRRAELLAINLKDLNLDGAEVLIRGKGGDEALQPMSQRAVAAIREYLPMREELLTGMSKRRALAAELKAQGKSFREIAAAMKVSVPVAFKMVAKPAADGSAPTDALLIGRQGRLKASHLLNILKGIAARTSIDKSVYPHLLRHCFATHLLNGGANLREVQELMRHKKLGTTEIYTHVSRTALKEAFRRAHPRGEINS